jgi:hypothetical protein
MEMLLGVWMMAMVRSSERDPIKVDSMLMGFETG